MRLLAFGSIFVLTFSFLNSFAGTGMCGDAIITPSPIFASTVSSCFSSSRTDNESRLSLFVEASPLAANFLTTGEGLDNPALVYAMYLVSQGSGERAEELALKVIEEANK